MIDEGQAAAGAPAGTRLILEKSDDVELNQIIGRHVTLEGTRGAVDAITDPATQTPAAGAGADPSQTREEGIPGMRVTAVLKVGQTCEIENR